MLIEARASLASINICSGDNGIDYAKPIHSP
jgi:hypothetical protein